MRRLKSVWIGLLLIVGILIPGAAFAQPKTTLLPDPCGLVGHRSAGAADIFARLDEFTCGEKAAQIEAPHIWVSFNAMHLPPMQQDRWVFKHRYGRIRSEQVWFRYDDGQILPSPTPFTASGQSFSTADLVFEAPRHEAAITGILVKLSHFQNVRGLAPRASVEPASLLAVRAQSFHLFYGLFVGMMFITLLYALMFFVVLRHRFLLAYAAFSASVLLFSLSWSGGLSDLAQLLGSYGQAQLNFLGVGLCVFTSAWFFVTFVETRFLPKAGARCAVLISTIPLLTLAVRNLDIGWQWRLMDGIFFSTACATYIALIGLSALAARRGSAAAMLLLLGWSAPVSVAIMRLMWASGLVDIQSDLFDIGVFMAVIVEVVVTSIGIVLRVRQVRVERDAAHLRELALRELADTDPLTGLYNRRSFLDKVMDSDEPKRLILLDVDHFKAVNDRYGHLVGDDVLVELSQALRRAVPPGAIIGRLGGEEFGIAVRADQTPTLPQALCRRIAETRFPRDLKITVSVGYALGQIVDDLSWKAIYSAADQALLSAKQAGRNRAKRTAIPVAA